MWTLKSGERVVNRHNSHLHGEVAELLPAALAAIESGGNNFLVGSHDFGRVIGESVCVGTTDADEIVFAQRPRRAGLSRFVKNRAAEPCSALVAILMKARDEAKTYVLVSAFVGHPAEPEPWDRNATEKSVMFWNSHALIWGSEPVIPGTETTACPW